MPLTLSPFQIQPREQTGEPKKEREEIRTPSILPTLGFLPALRSSRFESLNIAFVSAGGEHVFVALSVPSSSSSSSSSSPPPPLPPPPLSLLCRRHRQAQLRARRPVIVPWFRICHDTSIGPRPWSHKTQPAGHKWGRSISAPPPSVSHTTSLLSLIAQSLRCH